MCLCLCDPKRRKRTIVVITGKCNNCKNEVSHICRNIARASQVTRENPDIRLEQLPDRTFECPFCIFPIMHSCF